MPKYKRYIKPLVNRTEEDNLILRQVALSKGLPERIYEDFAVFAHYMVPKFGKEDPLDWQWFHYAICDHYNQVIFGKSHFLSMEIGPRTGKSILTALFVVYMFGLRPKINIMYSTYNESQVVTFIKDYLITFIKDKKYIDVFEHIGLKDDLDKKDQSHEARALRKTQTYTDTTVSISNPLTLEAYGVFRGVAIGQGIHGKSANIFIVDDYVGKSEDVGSELFRTKRNRWFAVDMGSRLESLDSVVIALCTRWYFEDIIGQFHKLFYNGIKPLFKKLGSEPPTLEVIKYRAENRINDEFKDPLDPRTEEGELLWPDKALQYESIRQSGDDFEALCNCDPTATDGEEKIKLEDFGFYNSDELPTYGNIYVSIDAAGTATGRSDKSAITVWLVCGANKYLLKIYYVKMRQLELADYVYDLLTNEWADYHECIIEHASGGIVICEHLIKNKKMRGIIPMAVTGRPVGDVIPQQATDKIKVSNSKLERYNRILSIFKKPKKTVFLPEHKIEHLDELLNQVTKFTGESGKKDDLADSFVYFLLRTKNNVAFINNNVDAFIPVGNSSNQGFMRLI